jgi:hypothetical protein
MKKNIQMDEIGAIRIQRTNSKNQASENQVP